jgi:hypothetical protein
MTQFMETDMRARLWEFLLLAFTVLLPWEAVTAGQVEGAFACEDLKECTVRLNVRGVIDQSTADRITQLLSEANTRTRKSEEPDRTHFFMTLDSPGGSVVAAMAIGRLARHHRMMAVVPLRASCASACVLIYAGAVTRMAGDEQIGIHAPFLDTPAAKINEQTIRWTYTSLVQDLRSYFREMNVSEGLADEMLKTPASSVRFLTHLEQVQYGLATIDPIEAEVVSLRRAKEFGLTRVEYNRRQALVSQHCFDRGETYLRSCESHIYKTGQIYKPDFGGLDFTNQAERPTR